MWVVAEEFIIVCCHKCSSQRGSKSRHSHLRTGVCIFRWVSWWSMSSATWRLPYRVRTRNPSWNGWSTASFSTWAAFSIDADEGLGCAYSIHILCVTFSFFKQTAVEYRILFLFSICFFWDFIIYFFCAQYLLHFPTSLCIEHCRTEKSCFSQSEGLVGCYYSAC